MASILTLAVGLPIGAGISYLLEERRQCLPCLGNSFYCCCCCYGDSGGGGGGDVQRQQQQLQQHDVVSISTFLQRRIHAYTILTWSGFAVFIYLLWTRSDGMAFVDPHAAATTHSLVGGLVLGGVSGMLLGCGLAGSILNYQQIRAGDREIQNSDLAIQLITNDEEMESTLV